MKRYLRKPVLEDLEQKMVFIGGPRQVGKTTLSLDLVKKYRYLNWDVSKDRELIIQEHFPIDKFIIFDEIHKFKNWRNYIKGFYDKYKKEKKILVTGSARLDYYRHSGDSLQGRYHYYRLHPFTVKELGISSKKEMKDLLTLGGFPEPFLSGSLRSSLRWQKAYRTRVIYEDISDLELSQNLSKMNLLLLRLPDLVGSPLSINALREDLSLAHKTVANYLDIFERNYLIYRLPPFHSKKFKSIKKEQKHYHYNWAEVKEEGFRFENLIAGHLLKWVHFKQDYEGEKKELCYFRDIEKREIDFIVTENDIPIQAIECKIKTNQISPHLKYFKAKFPKVECIQVHLELGEEYLSKEGIKSLNWNTFLNTLI
ncbi:MAG: ATP-binding protein [Bdellovibrionales bacterium]